MFVKIVDMGYRHTSVVVCSILRYSARKGFVWLKRKSVFERLSETVWVRKMQENAAKSKQAWVDTTLSSRQAVNGMEEIC